MRHANVTVRRHSADFAVVHDFLIRNAQQKVPDLLKKQAPHP